MLPPPEYDRLAVSDQLDALALLAAADRPGSRRDPRPRREARSPRRTRGRRGSAPSASGTRSRSTTTRQAERAASRAGVGGDPVREVEHRVGVRGEPPALLEPDRRTDVGAAAKGRAGGAERAGDDEQVAGTRASAAGHALGAADRGHGEDERVGPGRVAPDDRNAGLARAPRRARRRPRGASRRSRRARRPAPSGVAPAAARSLRFTAAARKPRSRHVIQSRRKWTPSTRASCVTTAAGDLCDVVLDALDEPAALELGQQRELAEVRDARHRAPRAPLARRGSRGPLQLPARPASRQARAFAASIPPIATTGT